MRTIEVKMADTMWFEPDRIAVREGEIVRFRGMVGDVIVTVR